MQEEDEEKDEEQNQWLESTVRPSIPIGCISEQSWQRRSSTVTHQAEGAPHHQSCAGHLRPPLRTRHAPPVCLHLSPPRTQCRFLAAARDHLRAPLTLALHVLWPHGSRPTTGRRGRTCYACFAAGPSATRYSRSGCGRGAPLRCARSYRSHFERSSAPRVHLRASCSDRAPQQPPAAAAPSITHKRADKIQSVRCQIREKRRKLLILATDGGCFHFVTAPRPPADA